MVKFHGRAKALPRFSTFPPLGQYYVMELIYPWKIGSKIYIFMVIYLTGIQQSYLSCRMSVLLLFEVKLFHRPCLALTCLEFQLIFVSLSRSLGRFATDSDYASMWLKRPQIQCPTTDHTDRYSSSSKSSNKSCQILSWKWFSRNYCRFNLG